MKIFVGSSNPPLAEAICSAIGIEPGKISITAFPDGETLAKIEENVRDRFKHLTSYPPSGLITLFKKPSFWNTLPSQAAQNSTMPTKKLIIVGTVLLLVALM